MTENGDPIGVLAKFDHLFWLSANFGHHFRGLAKYECPLKIIYLHNDFGTIPKKIRKILKIMVYEKWEH